MCVCRILKTVVACLWVLKNYLCPGFVLGVVFAFDVISSKIYSFDVTHFWIDSLKSGAVVRVASRFEFEVGEIGRKQIVRVIWPMTAVWLTLLL